jgi:hypothetical protein
MSSPHRCLTLRHPLALGACLFIVWGCAHLRVETDYDTDLDFSQFRSFTWLEPPVTVEPSESPVDELVDPFEKNTLLDKRVRQAVERELLARGYGLAPDGRSEFELQYHVLLKDRTKIRSYSSGYSMRGPAASRGAAGPWVPPVRATTPRRRSARPWRRS